MEPENAAFEIKTEGGKTLARTLKAGVNPGAVLHALLEAGVPASYGQAEDLVSLSPGTWMPLSRISEEGPRAEVRVLPDALSAEARIVWEPDEAAGEAPGREGLLQALSEARVSFGVDEKALCALSEGRVLSGIWIPVAAGEAPTDGVNARIEELVPAVREALEESASDFEKARVDPKERNLVRNVRKGTVIAKKIPAVEGRDGTDVLGRTVRARAAKDAPLSAGPNTVLSDDGLVLSAVAGGHLVRENGRFAVQRVFEVPGDVDYGTGNLECAGGILVRGSVAEGFSVKACDDLEVCGIVEGACLGAGGRMILRSSVRGMGKGSLSCGGELFAEYADQCRIRCGADVRFGKALLHCDLEAEGSVLAMRQGRGLIAGGTFRAGGVLDCVTLGSEMGAKTTVEVGVSPKLLEKKIQLSRKGEELREKEVRIRKNISYLRKQAEGKGLSPAQELLARELLTLLPVVREEIEKADTFLEEIDRAIRSAKNRGTVLARGRCYPEVTVIIRGEAFVVREILEEVRFVYREGAVRLLPLED
ncbi:MAG: DUF342 domain-containing protein [Synergistales bacterium]